MSSILAIPPRMRKFPLWRGFPVHFTVFIDAEGKPNFKVMHEHRRVEAFRKNLCHLCGERMLIPECPPFALIGGPRCVEAHRFVDGPMHLECALYAAQACPFLSSPTGRYSTSLPVVDENDIIVEYRDVGNIRPARMALVLCETYSVERNPGTSRHVPFSVIGDQNVHANNPDNPAQWVCVAGPYTEIRWDIMPESKEYPESPGEIPIVAP